MIVGDKVRVLTPFDKHFPGVYTVDAMSLDGSTAIIYGDRSFDVKYLVKTKDGVTHSSPAQEPEPLTLEARIAALEAAVAVRAP